MAELNRELAEMEGWQCPKRKSSGELLSFLHPCGGWCPGRDSNPHAQKGTGPQPAAYAYSATGAWY